MQMGVLRRLAAFAAVVLSVLASTLVLGGSAYAATPLGRQNWVVSLAGFNTTANYNNYMRLGYLVFDPASDAVQHNFWTWSQTDYPLPVNSGDVYDCSHAAGNPRNKCPIHTAAGFTGDPNGHFTGKYAYNAASGQVVITWTSSTVNGTTTAVNLVETWAVSEHGTGLGRMALVADNYSITSGIGYGSTASLAVTSKVPMSTVRATQRTYRLEGQEWNQRQIIPLSGPFTVGPAWNACDDGSCLGYVQTNPDPTKFSCSPTSCCRKDANYDACVKKIKDTGDRRFYYLTGVGGGRRNSIELWCECLSYDQCYAGNSHVRPLLQVIDDSGALQGWVGAEVSPSRGNTARDKNAEFYSSFAMVA
ncbi:hypothetical protein [Kutzneria sp. CA-103260]|uniref:hypothetical protein n=1 Tax=Kutzneria sp. CA-103260 TaxID=2802641 RepID=UPI001BA4F5C0|nr:hypothetical protein [Kutzneria sp. CA-103260]QUQ63290.1 hypothetical protein JJ691_10020 [Kutzneria sp. CA-103260]